MPEAISHRCGEEHGHVISKLAEHDGVLTELKKLADTTLKAIQDHCGDATKHVTRYEMDLFKDEVRKGREKMSDDLTTIKDSLLVLSTKAETEEKMKKASLTRLDMYKIAAISFLGILINLLAKRYGWY